MCRFIGFIYICYTAFLTKGKRIILVEFVDIYALKNWGNGQHNGSYLGRKKLILYTIQTKYRMGIFCLFRNKI